MDTLTDYIAWLGELDFVACPFREADALVLCAISYYDLSPVFAQNGDTIHLRDCLPMIETGKAHLRITGGDMGNGEIFAAASRSKRFGSLTICHYEDIVRENPALQFAAMTFADGETFTCVVYRGTDATLAGWKENCLTAFQLTEAQRMAKTYAQKAIDAACAPDIFLTGHSKGANLALYAGCTLPDSSWERVSHLYLLDGPGFCPEVMDTALVGRVDSRATQLVPEFDVVGKIYAPPISDTRIVKSSRTGIAQHSVASWLIDHGSPALASAYDPRSVWISQTLNDWIQSIAQEERPAFVDDLFAALGAGEAKTLDDMTIDDIEAALIGFAKTNPQTRHILADLPKRAFFGDALDEPEEPRHQPFREWLKTSQLARGLALIVCGVGVFFASESLLDYVSLGLVALLAVGQLVLTIRQIVKKRGDADGLRDRIILTIVLFALCLIVLFKEQATFLLGSLIVGVLGMVMSYICAAQSRKDTTAFMRVLHVVESVAAGLYGLAFLVIPQATVYAYAMSIGVALVLDGLVRLARCGWLQLRRQR